MSLLDVENLSKSFGGLRALHAVSFSLEEGRLLGIMGPNGSGKTTLFNLIAGALAPDAGHIRLRGREIAHLAPHRICVLGVARTFQLVRLFPGLSVLENVLVGQRYGRLRRPAAAARSEAERLLALVGISERAHLPAGQLTYIDRKRLELARALATSPELLLLDEFLAGLNPAETAASLALSRGLIRQGLTILMVEHIVWALMEISHRVIVVSAGEKIADGAPADVAAHPAVLAAYLGSDGERLARA